MTEDTFHKTVLNGVEALQSRSTIQDASILALKTATNDMAVKIANLRAVGVAGAARRNAIPGELSPETARFLGGIAVVFGIKSGQLKGDRYEGIVKDIIGAETRTALTSSDIPLPTEYSGEVVQLVSQFGLARKWGTVFPLGAGSVKLPRLKTDTAFGLISGSGPVTEKSPQTEWVTFNVEKFGGLVRLPNEMDEDSVVPIGQFLGNYAARQIAQAEDVQFFSSTGVGSGVNGSVEGLCISTISNGKVTQMGSTKTHYSDATLTNYRTLRGVPDAAALATSAYYMHPSFEQLLASFNSAGDRPYNPQAQIMGTGANPFQTAPTLDGFPVRWIPSMPAYSTSANVSKVFALFGDLKYQYLGVRGDVRFATSTDAGFTTDEILIRALERFTIGLMATGAVGGLETAAS